LRKFYAARETKKSLSASVSIEQCFRRRQQCV